MSASYGNKDPLASQMQMKYLTKTCPGSAACSSCCADMLVCLPLRVAGPTNMLENQ
jgi:hypothetical protein